MSSSQKIRDIEIRKQLTGEFWPSTTAHGLTYIGIVLFTTVLYFRPYELFPALSALSSIALMIGIATFLIYVPTQFANYGNLTSLPTEVKCLLLIAAWAVLTIPLAKDPGLAWTRFHESFLKIVMIFVIMANILNNISRIKGLIWLGVAAGAMLGYQAIGMYRAGNFSVEGYRVKVDFGGMFGNPNDMAIHLVIYIPLAIALGMSAKRLPAKLACFLAAGLMIGGVLVTQSRGGFLGLLAAAAILTWKLGKQNRIRILVASSFATLLCILLAPGNYAVRLLSIFDSSLDPVTSSDQRWALLIQSIWVTLRNPLGIGFANFPIVGHKNLETHNAYTQVSSELGWIPFILYVWLLVTAVRRLGMVERLVSNDTSRRELHILTIGVMGGLVAYMVSSFFGPVAYNWYVYYPLAYAIGLRRVFVTEERTNNAAAEAAPTINFGGGTLQDRGAEGLC